jgi:hypothetical protein
MKISNKVVQVHYECVCGYNEVYQDYLLIRWKDLSKSGIKRRNDKRTGKIFLSTKIKSDSCEGHDREE